MSTMAAVGLPTRKYNVDLIKQGRSHFYQVLSLKGESLGIFPGVTGKLQVINKPALVNWAANQGVARAMASLIKLLGGAKDAETEKMATLIAEAIKGAKKKEDFVTAMAAELFGAFKLTKKTAKMDHAVLAGIIQAAIEAPNRVKEEAADLGTQAHQVFDRIVKGEEVKIEDVPEAIRNPVQSFLDWLKTSGIQVVMGDTRVASIKEKFGGSLDALGWRDGKYILIDFKTSNGIYEEYALQVSAYAHAFEETFGVPVEEAHIVRFGKTTPDFESKRLANLTVSYGAFAAASELQGLLKDFKHFDE